MRPTDNDPKGNDPIDRDPTNEEIVDYLQRATMHFCPVLLRQITKKPTIFEFRTDLHHFEAMFVDLTPKSKVLCTTTAEAFDKYPRAKALKSLLHDQCFKDVEAFAVACRNALGDNIETFDLAGSIFVDDKCVDEILDTIEDKRFAEVFQEPCPSPVEDKTDEKELASPADDKTDDKEVNSPAPADDKTSDEQEVTTKIKKLQAHLHILTQIVTMLCAQADFHRE
jgi:hypothetical protein